MAEEEAEVRWIDCNIGSRLTMKYPGVILKGRKARGEVLSIALANNGQHQDTGAKMVHAAEETSSNIIAKSVSIGSGRSSYRGLVKMPKHLKNCMNNTECDALLINSDSQTDTYPAISVQGDRPVQHEATVSKVSAEQIFYMQQRGLSEPEAMSLCVNGFVNDLIREFPMEYRRRVKKTYRLRNGRLCWIILRFLKLHKRKKMSNSLSPSIFDQSNTFSSFVDDRSWEPGWLADFRMENWNLYQDKLQSKLKDENWRFSPKSRFSLSEIDSIADSKDLLCLESENSSNARFLDFNKMILDFPSEISKITDYLGPELGALSNYYLTSSLFNDGFF